MALIVTTGVISSNTISLAKNYNGVNAVVLTASVQGWVDKDRNWYYQKADGSNTIGWDFISGEWYYLKDDGAMVTG